VRCGTGWVRHGTGAGARSLCGAVWRGAVVARSGYLIGEGGRKGWHGLRWVGRSDGSREDGVAG
jgi:hypothetical protein